MVTFIGPTIAKYSQIVGLVDIRRRATHGPSLKRLYQWEIAIPA